jgi:hypothetical protein
LDLIRHFDFRADEKMSLALLKAEARVTLDRSFSLKSYLNSARKVYAEAEASDDLRDAYVGFCKYANLMSVALTHPGELASCQTEAVHETGRDRISDGQARAKQGFL